MKTMSLQLVTVGLENGKRAVFVGGPLIAEDDRDGDSQVDEIWFSNIQNIPSHLTVAELFQMLQEQVTRRRTTVH